MEAVERVRMSRGDACYSAITKFGIRRRGKLELTPTAYSEAVRLAPEIAFVAESCEPPQGRQRLFRGAVGITKAVLGIQTLRPLEVYRRREICRTCEFFNSSKRGFTDRCSKCGCFLTAKTVLEEERCPVGKW
jgi:hypothetical protein